jgi:lysozyme
MIVVAFAFLFYQQGFYKKVVATKDKKEFVWGIDLSHHQRNVDFDKLITENKPAFVFLKATEGKSHIDVAYADRLNKFRELGIPVGGYHFFNYNVSGKEQADHYIRTADLQKGDLFPVLDVEMKHSSSQNKQWIVKEIKSFCEVVKDKYGVEPIIYCEYDYYRKYLKDDFSDHQYWISDFFRAPRCKYVMWQYDILHVEGVGSIDNNRLAEGVRLEDLIFQ